MFEAKIGVTPLMFQGELKPPLYPHTEHVLGHKANKSDICSQFRKDLWSTLRKGDFHQGIQYHMEEPKRKEYHCHQCLQQEASEGRNF